MNELIACSECCARINMSAPKCPKCGTMHTRGVLCVWCGQVLRVSDAVTWDRKSLSVIPCTDLAQGLYHHRCLKEITPEPMPKRLPCRQCGTALCFSDTVRRSDGRHEQAPCPECGTPQPMVVRECSECTVPIVPSSHHYHWHGDYNRFYVQEKGWLHSPCYERRFRTLVGDLNVQALWLGMKEYDGGHLIRESNGRDRQKEVLQKVCQKAKELGRHDVTVALLNGPFKSIFGNEIDGYGIAKKNLRIGNLAGDERRWADEVAELGYSVFVSSYPFRLTIRL